MKTLRPVLPAVLVCLGLNLVLLAGIALRNPEYLSDYRLAGNPDSHDYILIGQNLLKHGEYSRSMCAPPYIPDMLRTPVYPVFAGGLTLLGGPLQLYLIQSLLHAGSCVL